MHSLQVCCTHIARHCCQSRKLRWREVKHRASVKMDVRVRFFFLVSCRIGSVLNPKGVELEMLCLTTTRLPWRKLIFT